MPNSFANDGAIGAGDNLGAGSGSAGFDNSNFGGSTPTTGSPSYGTSASGSGSHGGGLATQAGLDAFAAAFAPGAPTTTGFAGTSPTMSFAAGGAVPEDDSHGADSSDSNGSPAQDRISKALDSVDQVLAYSYKMHGLGGDQNSGGAVDTGAAAPQQMAQNGYSNGRMPAIPGSQSNSGQPPLQPQPGPLPPTSNPFGKRTADAGQDQDQDGDQDGAIATEETA